MGCILILKIRNELCELAQDTSYIVYFLYVYDEPENYLASLMITKL